MKEITISVRLFVETEDTESILQESIAKLEKNFTIDTTKIEDYWKIPEYQIISIRCRNKEKFKPEDIGMLFGESWVIMKEGNSEISSSEWGSYSLVSAEDMKFFNPEMKWANIEIWW